MERSKAGMEKNYSNSLSHPNAVLLSNNNNHNIVVFYKIWEKYNEIQLTKNKMDLNNGKMTNHPPLDNKGIKFNKIKMFKLL